VVVVGVVLVSVPVDAVVAAATKPEACAEVGRVRQAATVQAVSTATHAATPRP